MKNLLASERLAALVLLISAALALCLANTQLADNLFDLKELKLGFEQLALNLTVGHWISDFLLAIFFMTVAIELKEEIRFGQLSKPKKAALPAIAAAGGVALPIVIYLLLTQGSGYESGWPIPTATDIAFSLGLLAVFGKWIPKQIRIFLLTLAVLDDFAGILFIAFGFSSNLNFGYLLLALLLAAGFALLTRAPINNSFWNPIAKTGLIVLGFLTWFFIYQSGVHATIAGVILGFCLPMRSGTKLLGNLQPWTSFLILPLFAFSSALVSLPDFSQLSFELPFWAILVSLPLGKMLGISLSSAIAQRVLRVPTAERLSYEVLLSVGALGGIGFTVSLLLNDLAFAANPLVRDQGVLAVLLGSVISMIIAAILLSKLNRKYHLAKE